MERGLHSIANDENDFIDALGVANRFQVWATTGLPAISRKSFVDVGPHAGAFAGGDNDRRDHVLKKRTYNVNFVSGLERWVSGQLFCPIEFYPLNCSVRMRDFDRAPCEICKATSRINGVLQRHAIFPREGPAIPDFAFDVDELLF